MGVIAFSPLAQGLLTDRYLNGIPDDSCAAVNKGNGAIDVAAVTPERVARVRALDAIAQRRNQTLAKWRWPGYFATRRVTSVLTGASRPEQVVSSVGCLKNMAFSAEELAEIDAACAYSHRGLGEEL